MSEHELDELLRRYRPATPPAELRNRLTSVRPTRRTWPWAAAAAAVFLVTVGLHVSTERIYRVLGDSVETGSSFSLDQLPALNEALGDDQWLRSTLEEVIRREWEPANAASASAIDTRGSWQ
jgi:hypothetical protein